jgi:hypothetical protein
VRRIQQVRKRWRTYVLIKTDSVTVDLLLPGDEEGSSDVANTVLYTGFEVFTAVTLKNAVLWDVTPCR